MQTVAVDLADDSDVGLLLLIGAATDSPEDQSLARDALRELHRRHYGYVIGVLKRFAENVGTVVIDPEEWASKTFVKAFKNAGSFSDRSNGNAEAASAQVRSWLGLIAQNAAKDELDRLRRTQNCVPLVALSECDVSLFATLENDAVGDPEKETPTSPAALARLRELLNGLKPEEQDVLMTYAVYGEPTPNGRELPRGVREALEIRTGYERSNIRQKWRRLSQRLKTELEPLLEFRK